VLGGCRCVRPASRSPHTRVQNARNASHTHTRTVAARVRVGWVQWVMRGSVGCWPVGVRTRHGAEVDVYALAWGEVCLWQVCGERIIFLFVRVL
jgi:hypothetical protein